MQICRFRLSLIGDQAQESLLRWEGHSCIFIQRKASIGWWNCRSLFQVFGTRGLLLVNWDLEGQLRFRRRWLYHGMFEGRKISRKSKLRISKYPNISKIHWPHWRLLRTPSLDLALILICEEFSRVRALIKIS